jgi:hypothetical protein
LLGWGKQTLYISVVNEQKQGVRRALSNEVALSKEVCIVLEILKGLEM